MTDSSQTADPAESDPTGVEPAGSEPAAADSAVSAESAEPREEPIVVRNRRKIDVATPVAKPTGGAHAAPEKPAKSAESKRQSDAAASEVLSGELLAGAAEAEVAALRAELAERTGDLQRVTAEYANYRRRVDRDRSLAAEQATGQVLAALLPVLDDLDRAREHGDLVGPFGTVAEQLLCAVGKFGLTAFGAKGDPFDPTRHEAVAHLTSPEVTEPTCVDVMRRGYTLGERLLRPAMVAVADPE